MTVSIRILEVAAGAETSEIEVAEELAEGGVEGTEDGVT